MKHFCKSFFVVLLLVPQMLIAQHWNPSDSLKISKDRLDDFRGNIIDYTGQDLIDASFPNSWPLFGSKARMSIGGYVKIDYIQDLDGAYDRFQYEIQNVPVEGDGRPQQSGYMNMHARESRFNLDVRSITETGMPVRVFFEFDFYNLDRSPFNQTLRLRHAYGVLGRLLIGRTWGTQSDLFAVPVTIDFAAGDALMGTRRAQIRFEDKINDKYNYAVALEMLEFPGVDGRDFEGQTSQSLPLLVGRITKKTASGGRLFLGASLFQLRWDGEGAIPNSTAVGWGFSFSGREYFGEKKHWFRWMANYGQGWGSQIVATLGTQASAILNDEGKLETMPAWNLGSGVAINISEKLTSNFNLNYYSITPSEFRDNSKMKSGSSGHINLIWSPYKKVDAGIEYMRLQRINGDSSSGTGNRIQMMIKYNF
jgi:DcaP outer membrane protein